MHEPSATTVQRKRVAEIRDTLERLEAALAEDHSMTTSAPNWADVGTLAEYAQRLDALYVFVRSAR